MFKKVLITTFLGYYLIFMVLPNLPFVQYYYGLHSYNNKQVISNNNAEILVGDICFIRALVDRTKKDAETAETEIPTKPNNRTVNLIYLLSSLANLKAINNYQNIEFHNQLELLTYRYLQIPSPPPKFL